MMTMESGLAGGIGERLMIIDGERVEAASGLTIDVFDPATGERIGSSPRGDRADVDQAVAAARASFVSGVWSGLSGAERQAVLWRASDIMAEHAPALVRLEGLNSGMLMPFAQATVGGAVEMLRYYAGAATKIYGRTAEVSGGGMGQFHAYTLSEPIGVAAMIIPWNVPVALTVIKLAAALAAGCSCIIKPSEETPFSALSLVEIFEQAGVPRGVINVVTGYGHEAGAALAAHPGVDKIAFTGSSAVGKLIVQAAAGNLKKVTLELGGKSPVVMFDDCSMERAIPGIAGGIFAHSGQICIAGSRLYVQRRIFDQTMEGLAAVARSLKVGSASDHETQIGPLISARQQARVMELITSGIDEGAALITGGRQLDRPGYYVEPTILATSRPDARIVREEIFGPVLTATPFDDFEEAMGKANDTEYGLAAAIWTNDLSRAHLAAKRLQAGVVWINCHFFTSPSLPAGGYRQSGWGKELGPEGLEAYMQSKTVYAALGG